MKLIHFSSNPNLKTIDPQYMGSSGIAGAQYKRGLPENKTSFFYTADSIPEDIVTRNAPHKYAVDLPEHFKIYDFDADPEHLEHKARQINSGAWNEDVLHSVVKDHGYHGIQWKMSPETTVVQVYHPLHVGGMSKSEPLYKIKAQKTGWRGGDWGSPQWVPLEYIKDAEVHERGNEWFDDAPYIGKGYEAMWVTHKPEDAELYGEPQPVDLSGAHPVHEDPDGGFLYVRPAIPGAKYPENISAECNPDYKKNEDLQKAPIIADQAPQFATEELERAAYSPKYHNLKTFDLGDGLYHHILTDKLKPDNIIHTLSYGDPKSPISMIKGYRAGDGGLLTSITATRYHQQGKGLGTRLKHEALKVHGKLYSDSTLSPAENTTWHKLAESPNVEFEPGYEVDGNSFEDGDPEFDDGYYSLHVAKLKRSEELEKGLSPEALQSQGYKFKILPPSKRREAYAVTVHHKGKRVGHLMFAKYPNLGSAQHNSHERGFHEVYRAQVDPEHRNKGLYQHMLNIAADHVKSMGSKGLVSMGYQRSPDATHAWNKAASFAVNPNENTSIKPMPYSADFFIEKSEELEKGLNGDWKKEGYKLKIYNQEDQPHGRYLQIRAFNPRGLEVGRYSYGHAAGSPNPEVAFIHTFTGHTRKGLATAAHQMAEQYFGAPLKPAYQSDEAKALWAQPNRPFGKAEDLDKGANGDWEKEGYKLSKPKKLKDGYYYTMVHPQLKNIKGSPLDVGSLFVSDGIAQNVWVNPEHRRKGIANALYNYAESHLKIKLQPSDTQTPAGKSLWSQTNRPFGKAEQLAKAPLVFDSETHGQPYTEVWRMQNEQGQGPYMGTEEFGEYGSEDPSDPMFEEWIHPWQEHNHNASSRTPSPYGDWGFYPNEVAQNFQPKHFFGFESLDHLNKWFTPEEQKKLADKGFKPVKVKAKKVWSSGAQAFYEPYEEPKSQKLTASEKLSLEEENKLISENIKSPEAKRRHKFKPARWTHPNGHPRCIICRAEERIGGYCDPVEKSEDLGKSENENKLCTMFLFEGVDKPDILHVTHKYFGKEFKNKEAIIKVIEKWFKENPFESFTEIFDKEEWFGTDKDVRVLRPESNKKFLPKLKEKLDELQPDKWPEYKPHASVSSNVDKIDFPIVDYVLVDGGKVIWSAADKLYKADFNVFEILRKDEKPFVQLNPAHGKMIADAYGAMKHDPHHPEVKAAYDALISETGKQYQDLLNQGYKFSKMKPGQENPYPTSKHLHADLENNKHMWYFPTEQGYGTNGEAPKDHPLLKPTEFHMDGAVMPANDLFRIVHDVNGHYKGGKSTFGPKGEHQAYLTHKKMFSPLAQRALASETLMQNSWVNFSSEVGDHNRKNPHKTIYAEQKAAVAPDWVVNGRWHE